MGLDAGWCFGEWMTGVGGLHPASLVGGEERSVTILGVTGSIGASTVDLIRRTPERYRVESISALRNAKVLAKIAREIGARHAVVADPAAYGELKDALSGSHVEAGAGED